MNTPPHTPPVIVVGCGHEVVLPPAVAAAPSEPYHFEVWGQSIHLLLPGGPPAEAIDIS